MVELWLNIIHTGCPAFKAHSEIMRDPPHKCFAHPYLMAGCYKKKF